LWLEPVCPEEDAVNDRQELLASLMAVRREWERVLDAQAEAQLTAPRLPGGWSVRDVITHLAAWQQISTARVWAAQEDSQPEYPAWLGGADPFDAEEHTGQFNDRIVELHSGQAWPAIRPGWRGALRASWSWPRRSPSRCSSMRSASPG
jgi:hypothetical protein